MLLGLGANCSTLSGLRHAHILRRYLSSKVSYNDKVFAIPFAFDKYRAIQETYLHALNLTTPIDASFSDYFKRILPFLKRDSTGFMPTRIQPLYFPTWRIECEALSKLTDSEDDIQTSAVRVEDASYVLSRNLYHPGHHMMPLSTLSFAACHDDSHIIQWHESMSRLSDGTDIVCLPYTLSPLEFAETLRNGLIQTGIFDDEKLKLFSLHIGPVYPVLFPGYLVQYPVFSSRSGYKPEPLTIVLEGHKESGAIFAENINDFYLHPSLSFATRAVLSPLEHKENIPLEITSDGKPSSFISVYRSDLPPSVWACVDHLSSSPVQSVRLRRRILNVWQVSKQNVDWNDIRIRSPTTENRTQFETFQSVKMVIIGEHMRELQQQSATQTGDLAALHTFLYGCDGGEELRKTQPSWYHESLRKHTAIIKQ